MSLGFSAVEGLRIVILMLWDAAEVERAETEAETCRGIGDGMGWQERKRKNPAMKRRAGMRMDAKCSI
jgi:hypothetical protein